MCFFWGELCWLDSSSDGLMVLSPKKLPPSNALFLRRATFVNAVKYGVGLAGSEKGRTVASAIGNSGAAEEWHGREREQRSLHSG